MRRIERFVRLRFGPLAPLGRLRQQIERPGQPVRRRFVTGADEGDDVGANVGLGHADAGFRILRAEQQGQEIARRFAAPLEQRLAAVDDRVDRGVEELERRATAPAPEARQEGRRANQIERIEPSETVEVARHRTLEFARLAVRAPARTGSAPALRASRATSDSPTSVTAPSRRCRRRSTVAAATFCMGRANSAMWRGENSGASERRCSRHASPSAVRRPLPSPGLRTRSCSSSLR